jgi:hypothetical protein
MVNLKHLTVGENTDMVAQRGIALNNKVCDFLAHDLQVDYMRVVTRNNDTGKSAIIVLAANIEEFVDDILLALSEETWDDETEANMFRILDELAPEGT